jgi:lysyl-tRNA synthetase, class I
MTSLHDATRNSKAWVYEEARKLLKRYPEGKAGAPVLFETGYGPSGLPHLGTFNEVLRTTMVRKAYEEMVPGAATRLVAFSDDMDGLRKVPDNVPEQEMLRAHLGKPLTQIPDPFGKFESFAAHNNNMLCDFLNRFGFEGEYEFVSSTQQYGSGAFDAALVNVLEHFNDILAIMLPTLRAERRETYSPVLPISPKSGQVLQVPVRVLDAKQGLVRFHDDGEEVEQCIFKGKAKLQWKVDWAMRWAALGVDYEMSGKDLLDSVAASSKICRVLGAKPPETMSYEMFLDEKGEKISKSKGNGLSMEQWLRYGSNESLAFYAYREPKKAKQLHIGVIARAVDEYYQFRAAYPTQALEQQLGNPAHHIHNAMTKGHVPQETLPVSFGLMLNLVGVMGAEADKHQVWAYLKNYAPEATPENNPELEALVGYALAYNRDYVAPTLQRRAAIGQEIAGLQRLEAELVVLGAHAQALDIQNSIYAIGNDIYGKEGLRDWFKALYETLLGSSQGPRMGSFIALYGIENSLALIRQALMLRA